MERRGHLDPAELDALLLGGAQARGVTVESFHVEGCRTCREALLHLALMAGILRGAHLTFWLTLATAAGYALGGARSSSRSSGSSSKTRRCR